MDTVTQAIARHHFVGTTTDEWIKLTEALAKALFEDREAAADLKYRLRCLVNAL